MKSYQTLIVGGLFGILFNLPMVWAADSYIAEGGSDLGLYLSFFGGWNYADGDKFEVPSVPISGEIFFLDGWTGAVALGGHITDHFRTEFELAVRHNALDDEDLAGIGTIDLTGEVNVYTGLLKVAYDFGDGPFRPFIAAGIGLAKFDVQIDDPITGSDDILALAGSLEAGASYAMSANAELFADAEVLLLDDVTLDPTASGDSNLSNPLFVSASVGIRWKF